MSRDSQAALVALNRFGLGARGGASGDFVNAASDPRGFVKFELSRPNGVLLEMPGLQSTPDLAKAVFAYQDEVRKARESRQIGGGAFGRSAAATLGATGRQGATAQPLAQHRCDEPCRARVGNAKARNESAGQWRQRGDDGGGRADAAECGDGAQRAETAATTAQHHPEDVPRRGAGAVAALGARRLRIPGAAGGVLVQPLLHFRQQGPAGADVGGRVRARGDQAACARAFRRHVEGGRAASGHAVLPRQPAIAGAGLARRDQPQAGAERKSRPRDHGIAYARRRQRLHPGRRHLARAHHHRVDLCRAAGDPRHARQFCVQRQRASAWSADPARQDLRD